ncbi:MAG: AAA family ATPase [Thermoanaerobaculia bacterium]
MITLVEALNYRCLRHIHQPLDSFHVLVGPNASGKTTFLDVISFISHLASNGLSAAIEERTHNFYDLVWRREGARVDLAVEIRIPEQLQVQASQTARYEVSFGLFSDSGEIEILKEQLTLKNAFDPSRDRIVVKREQFNLTYAHKPEVVRISPGVRQRSVLQIWPLGDDAPLYLWLVNLLTSGVQKLTLNSASIRKASPPGQGTTLRPDGANLPWVVADLKERSPERFQQWIAHLRTAFPDLEDIKTVERPEDRHRYLMLQYKEGLEVPSWMASDGTLRMLALTLPAYLDDFKGIYLVEEPENGIHPRAIETMTQSLSSVYNAQVLLATHSPVVLSTVEAEQILCFSKDAEGATQIIRGSEHPALQSWKHETTLGTLFAAGVLG